MTKAKAPDQLLKRGPKHKPPEAIMVPIGMVRATVADRAAILDALDPGEPLSAFFLAAGKAEAKRRAKRGAKK